MVRRRAVDNTLGITQKPICSQADESSTTALFARVAMPTQVIYSDFSATTDEADLEGLLCHWDFVPPAGTLRSMLQGSSIAIVARVPGSSRVLGYVTALTDQVVCGYISALEVRPEYRHQGIGTALLVQVAGRLNVHGIYLSCAEAMVPFYEAAGFKQVVGMSKRRPR